MNFLFAVEKWIKAPVVSLMRIMISKKRMSPTNGYFSVSTNMEHRL